MIEVSFVSQYITVMSRGVNLSHALILVSSARSTECGRPVVCTCMSDPITCVCVHVLSIFEDYHVVASEAKVLTLGFANV